MIKYSFGIPILLGFFLAGYKKEALYALGVTIFAAVVFALKFDISIFESIFLPFKVATMATGVGPIDLMSLSRKMYGDFSILKPNPIIFIFLTVYILFIFVTYKKRNSLDENTIISTSILLSLVTFFHLGYDHVMFMVALLILLEKNKNKSSLLLLVVVFVLWFMPRFLKLFGKHNQPVACDMGATYSAFFIFLILYLISKLYYEQINKTKYKN